MKNKTRNVTDKQGSSGNEMSFVDLDGDGESSRMDNDLPAEEKEAIAPLPVDATRKADLLKSLDIAEFTPSDTQVEIFTESIEASIGYTSLIRQLNESTKDRITFLMTDAGGSMSFENVQKAVFRKCEKTEEAEELFDSMLKRPVDSLSFTELARLWDVAPRVAEKMWEMIKREGRKEFESGHFAANALFPPGLKKDAWSIAKYLGIRESFVDQWKPSNGIEIALIDTMAQAFHQHQFWTEQTILRSQTEPRREHEEYKKWKQYHDNLSDANSWDTGYWFPQYVDEKKAVDDAVEMADRWHRMFIRALRQLRDLRRFSPVTINNPKQVNIANDGSKQANISQ